MKLCDTHQKQLKDEIMSRGLGDLIAFSKEGEAGGIIIQAKDTRTTLKNYDPLVAANALIFRASLKVGGTYLLGKDSTGNEYCPICEGIAACKKRDSKDEGAIVLSWLTNSAKAVAEYAATLPPE